MSSTPTGEMKANVKFVDGVDADELLKKALKNRKMKEFLKSIVHRLSGLENEKEGEKIFKFNEEN